jgi:hypothetical protein
MVPIPDTHDNHVERVTWLSRGCHVHLRRRFTSSSSRQVYPTGYSSSYHLSRLFLSHPTVLDLVEGSSDGELELVFSCLSRSI